MQQLIKIDRNWEDRKAHKLLLKIFADLGASHVLVTQGRKQLSKLLF
jgi:thioredoxin-like negative regulator of GroEL